ncbi:hypothetical protein ACFE04_030660 [Oxalis oulophora]
MEQTPIDKTTILDVKPIRSLAPIFPSAPNFSQFPTPQGAPFVCAPPTGPFPSGVTPFYPFFDGSADSAHQNASYRTPIPNPVGRPRKTPNGDAAGSSKRGRKKGTGPTKAEKRKMKKANASVDRDTDFVVDTDAMVSDILGSFSLMEFSEDRRAEGDRESIGYVRLVFDLLRRKLMQIEELKGDIGIAKRPDLKAGNVLMKKGIRTNARKRIGAVPGLEIGEVFVFRMELCLVGLHAPSMAGIDYMSINKGQDEVRVAVSIVSSGGYDDNLEDPNILIYSGQGDEMSDQKLERGNLALEKSLHRGNEIRVIRGIKDVTNPTTKIYIYDGLYKIQESWIEKGKSGFGVFKYKMIRSPGQPEGWAIWKTIQQWKDGTTARSGVILQDFTSGTEKIHVSIVNDVDNEKGPAHFTYVPSLKYSRPLRPLEGSVGCFCHDECTPGDPNCSCLKKNGGDMVYAANGNLIAPKGLIHECGPSCQCPAECRNRASQGGLTVRLEVFRTKNKGWGLRSLDFIRSGAFIFEYAGEVVNESEAAQLWGENEEDYIFDTTRSYQPTEVMPAGFKETPKLPFPMIVNATNVGNVARFMNHSCSPNVFWQPVSRQNDKECDLHIAFYAIRHIPPMKELTFNYGIVSPEKSNQRRKRCMCGSPRCRGFFY